MRAPVNLPQHLVLEVMRFSDAASPNAGQSPRERELDPN